MTHELGKVGSLCRSAGWSEGRQERRIFCGRYDDNLSGHGCGGCCDALSELHAMHVDGYMFYASICAKNNLQGREHRVSPEDAGAFPGSAGMLGGYNLMMSPVYMEYLCGERDLDCCVWGSPVYGPQGWAAPCSC